MKKAIVATSGCFDILHRGHLMHFKRSKVKNSILVVGVNSDKAVKTYKGNKRPLNNEKVRLKWIKSLKIVDRACLLKSKNPVAWLRKLKPDFYTISLTKNDRRCKIKMLNDIRKLGIKVKIFKNYKNYSTTNLIKNS
jgi:rfaE bifunctional protein nucleotidyltransferase chain/domain